MNITREVAMFLGAGASKPFGALLTNQILPEIMKKLKDGTLFTSKNDRDTLKNFLVQLMPGIENIKNPSHVLITEVLSLIDYMLLSDFVPAPTAKAEELKSCRMLLERAMLNVIPGRHNRPGEDNTQTELKRLGEWMYETGNKSGLSLISTNYDEIVECELYKPFMGGGDRPFDAVNKGINFGLSWRDGERDVVFHPPADSHHSVLKLHGSIDWMKCDLCGWIVCNDNYTLDKGHLAGVGVEEKNPNNTCNCGHWPLRPVVIAPSLVRDIRDINILNVWKNACEELRTASYWYIIGYSLPIDDYAIRAMLIRALKSRKTPPKIHVYQWGDQPEMQDRYGAFLGECDFQPTGMEGFIKDVVNKGLHITAPRAQVEKLSVSA